MPDLVGKNGAQRSRRDSPYRRAYAIAGIEKLVRSVEATIADEERTLREIARREGRAFRGAERCTKQDPFAAPETKHVKQAQSDICRRHA